MPRYRLLVEYDGAPYRGFQRQQTGPTVQQAMEEALEAFAGERALVIAAGRTDAGVHALGMTMHVDLERDWEPFRLAAAWNAHLAQRGERIAVLEAGWAPPSFHARFSCIARAYRYRILVRRAPAVLDRRAWHWTVPLDVEAMRAGAAALIGRHDFTSFRHAHCQARSPVRTLDRLDIDSEDNPGGRIVQLEVWARSFLHHQVRSMAGALAHVGAGRMPPSGIAALLAARDRSLLPVNAPPHGLHFVGARYDPVGDVDRPS